MTDSPALPVSGKTALLALLAHPIGHVRAPEFFNRMFAARGIDAVLVPFDVRPEDLSDVTHRLSKLRNLRGCVVTMPHKQTMARLCDSIGPAAELSGAVNAVRFEPDGRRVGEMFDGVGLLRAMRAADIAVAGRRVLLVGAGGAARAIAMAFAADRPAALTIANRDAARAADLVAAVARAFPAISVGTGGADPTAFDVVVNATSLGLREDDPLPLDPARLRSTTDVVEIVPAREWTALLIAAHDRGCRTLGGRPMMEMQMDAMVEFFGLGHGR